MAFDGPPDERIPPFGFLRSQFKWPVDPTLYVPGATFPGKLADGHPRRCQGTKRDRISQCPFWAARDSLYCRAWHGGKRRLTSHLRVYSFYSARAGMTLRGLLQEAGQASAKERLSLDAEVDLMRLSTAKAVELFEITCLDPETSAKASDKVKAAATAHLQNALHSVGAMVERAAKARILSQETTDVQGVDFVVAQILAILEAEIVESLPDGKERMDRIKVAIDGIKLPRKGAQVIVV